MSRCITLSICKVWNDVAFLISVDVIMNLAREVVIIYPSWNHSTLKSEWLSTCNSNQAGLPSLNSKLLLLNWSICRISEIKEIKNLDRHIYFVTSWIHFFFRKLMMNLTLNENTLEVTFAKIANTSRGNNAYAQTFESCFYHSNSVIKKKSFIISSELMLHVPISTCKSKIIIIL